MHELATRSQGGANREEKSVVEYAGFLFLGYQFSQVKKYTTAVLLGLEPKSVLTVLENIIIEFACSDEFELSLHNLRLTAEMMKTFEYKLMAYLELYQKLVLAAEPKTADVEEEAGATKNPAKLEY
jgi:hypothetical protein